MGICKLQYTIPHHGQRKDIYSITTCLHKANTYPPLEQSTLYKGTQSDVVDLSFIQPPHTLSNLPGAPLLVYVALYRGNTLFINVFQAITEGGTGFLLERIIIFLA